MDLYIQVVPVSRSKHIPCLYRYHQFSTFVGHFGMSRDIVLKSDCLTLICTIFDESDTNSLKAYNYRIGPNEEIRIPTSVVAFREALFRNEASLSRVRFEGGSSFSCVCDSLFMGSSITEIDIPRSVTEIGESAFRQCMKLSHVKFAEDSILVEIGISAFTGCGIRAFVVPRNVKIIGKDAFSMCKLLVSFTFEDGSNCNRICNGAFRKTAITAIHIPASVVTIGDMCFVECMNLIDVQFDCESRLERIGEFAFRDAPRVVRFVVPPFVRNITGLFAGSNISSIVLPETIEEISMHSFTGSPIARIVIPKNVKLIDTGAFMSCVQLSCIDFEDGDEPLAIGTTAFSRTGVRSLRFPRRLRFIGKNAFGCATRLRVLEFPVESRLEEIGDAAFAGTMINIGTLRIPDSVKIVGKGAFATYNRANRLLRFGANSQLQSFGRHDLQQHCLVTYPLSYLRNMRGTLAAV